MKTYMDCIPCFLKQALQAAKIINANANTQKKILNEIAQNIPNMPMALCPPEIGKMIYGIVTKITKNKDPYKKIKKLSNKLALAVYPDLKKKINNAQDKLLMAIKLSIAGNIIDYGTNSSLNIQEELKKILAFESDAIKQNNRFEVNYKNLKSKIQTAKKLLILADNAGEIVFDKLLIEEILKTNKNLKIIYAVKEKPIINDALIEDALYCGIDAFATVISSGSSAPGTVLALCSNKFIAIFNKADIIISKGQGNFEALSKQKNKPIFFLFMAKCPVVAQKIGCKLYDINMYYHYKKTQKILNKQTKGVY